MKNYLMLTRGLRVKMMHHCLWAVPFFLPLSIRVSDVFLVVAAALWFCKLMDSECSSCRPVYVDWLILSFVVIAGLSINVSPNKAYSSYNYVFTLAKYLFLYYLFVANVTNEGQLKKIAGALLTSGVIVSLIGIYQYVTNVKMLSVEWVDKNSFPELATRVYSTLYNPNLLASFLIMILCLAMGFTLWRAIGGKKLILFPIAGCYAACLIFTYSRGAWISMLVCVAIFGFVFNKKILLSLLPLPLLLLAAKTSIMQRIQSIMNPTDTSFSLRVALWESTIEMVKEHPLLGIGWGSYWLVYPEYNFFIEDPKTIIYHAHNLYLHIAAEIGLLGFIIFIIIIASHLKIAYNIINKHKGSFLAALMAGICMAVIGILISGITDHVLFNIEVSLIFWLLLSLVRIGQKIVGP